MAALYTGQINNLGARLLHGTDVQWLGAFARDEIQELKHQRRPFALVVNTHEAARKGEHWLALYAARGSSKIEMFDSFGLDPKLYSLDQSLSFSISFSNRTIQDIRTKVCGHYALLFIYLRSRGRSFDYTIKSLYKNYTDSSAARKMLDLSQSKISHVHYTGQTCKIKS